MGTILAAGETRLSAGINLGWTRSKGLSHNLAASWSLEATLTPLSLARTQTLDIIGKKSVRREEYQEKTLLSEMFESLSVGVRVLSAPGGVSCSQAM